MAPGAQGMPLGTNGSNQLGGCSSQLSNQASTQLSVALANGGAQQQNGQMAPAPQQLSQQLNMQQQMGNMNQGIPSNQHPSSITSNSSNSLGPLLNGSQNLGLLNGTGNTGPLVPGNPGNAMQHVGGMPQQNANTLTTSASKQEVAREDSGSSGLNSQAPMFTPSGQQRLRPDASTWFPNLDAQSWYLPNPY
ncbi:unnamed protein product [Amoebophrya sp. A25]|nr:unnamed protein product [Amoebophrya sp. A25]|eukprot:GSA25T00004260001.1